jgi:hypothetical protein
MAVTRRLLLICVGLWGPRRRVKKPKDGERSRDERGLVMVNFVTRCVVLVGSSGGTACRRAQRVVRDGIARCGGLCVSFGLAVCLVMKGGEEMGHGLS